jgi:hypothetical protein
MTDLGQSTESTRECGWCSEPIVERPNGRLRAHQWVVGFEVDGEPIKDRCVGSGTTVADLEEAKR